MGVGWGHSSLVFGHMCVSVFVCVCVCVFMSVLVSVSVDMFCVYVVYVRA